MTPGDAGIVSFRGSKYRSFLDSLKAGGDAAQGEHRLTYLLEAVRLADVLDAPELRFLARMKLADYAVEHGQPRHALVAMAWCLPAYAEDPQRFRQGIVF